jgi:hypothetical protein
MNHEPQRGTSQVDIVVLVGSDTRDDEVDQLYQVPLGEFTAARNALAKARGAAGADIKSLEKPTLSAWAVNQLYWRERSMYDALVEASMAMRQAHVQVISGHSADVAAAESAHASIRRDAAQTARRLIEESGEKATPATIDAVAETLQALPAPDTTPGRLTKPLKPLSFAALMALGIPIQSAVRSPQSGNGGPGSVSKKERADRAAARRAAERALRSAETAEAKAEAVLEAAKKVVADAERELARMRDQVLFLEKQRTDAEGVVRKRERDVLDATNLRIQAAQALDQLPE